MKKFYVAQSYGPDSPITPTVVFMTDIYEDAVAYAGIRNRADNKEYVVLSLAE